LPHSREFLRGDPRDNYYRDRERERYRDYPLRYEFRDREREAYERERELERELERDYERFVFITILNKLLYITSFEPDPLYSSLRS
jgi:hypothetical protein